MKIILQNRRGETIVEVVVSFMLLLMFTAMFVVSLRYARAMSRKAETLRETAYAFCAGLYPTGGTGPSWQTESGKENLRFSFDQFTVDRVQLQSVETQAQVTEDDTTKEENYTFHRYYKEPTATTPGTGDNAQ